MKNLISQEKAREITGGRIPLIPIEYEAALKSLVSCCSIDDAKYWSDKADALAAWAKIYKNDEIGVEAKRLKLHAYRRMGVLAAELRPSINRRKAGPLSVLIEAGFSIKSSTVMRHLARMPDKKFNQIANQPRPQSPNAAALKSYNSIYSEAFSSFALSPGRGALTFRSFCQKNNPSELAAGIRKDEVVRAKSVVVELLEWLDEFERHLPKSEPSHKAEK